ncbi:MAG: hypothetical protein NTU83_12510 [Candidatus Hydrogenedentes bacterium]|nr:hypothetical protein [Candidatus Hydrogenedentota bacterium]
MTYTGHIQNGSVVLDEPAQLPEGAEVKVIVQFAAPVAGSSPRERVMQFAGTFTDLPEDAASNLEHYLYGHPKQ